MQLNSKSNRQAQSLVNHAPSSTNGDIGVGVRSKVAIQKSKISRGPSFDRRTTWERLCQIDEWIASGTYPGAGSSTN
jgi:hypothetical protein